MENTSVLKALILGLSIIITGWLLGKAFKARNAALDSISVIGLGTKAFVSDAILFSGSYSTRALDAKEAFAKVSADQQKVKAFFESKGFKASEFTFSGINITKKYKTYTIENANGTTKSEEQFDGYEGSQSISLSSNKNPELMKRIENIADQTTELVNSGIEFDANQIQYTYSDLPSLKHNLIENATKDAKERAQKIVKTADGDLGKLKTASMGVFQITGTGSNEDDSYGGNNDIYSKEKTARITVRLEYELE
jgi:uncharacterized protein